MSADRPHRTGSPPCPRFREAISARVDGEDPVVAADLVDAHVARCPDCRSFADAVARQHRRSRVRSAGWVPDLTEQILSRLDPGHLDHRGHLDRPGRGRRPTRLPGRRLVTGVGAVVLVAAAGFVGGGMLSDRVHRPAHPDRLAGPAPVTGAYPGATVMASGASKPRVSLVDTSGRRYDVAAATAHRVTLVYFGYTHCPDVCPINMALAAAAVRDLPARVAAQVTVVFITTDPARDTPRVIEAWLDNFDPGFVGLTGSPGAIERAEEEVHVPLSYALASTGAYQVVHAGYSLVYSQDGRAHLQVDDRVRPAELAVILERLVDHGFQEAK